MTPDKEDELARRVARAYDEVLVEPVPQRLTDLLSKTERARRRAPKQPAQRWTAAPWTWAHWAGMAASLVIGISVGALYMSRASDDALVVERAGRFVAGAPLAQALDARLASERDARFAVQLSFVDRSGAYCRTFTAPSLAGLACRDGANWNLVATSQPQPAPAGEMRQAASALPRPVLDAVDARIAGNALDASQERAARDRGWRR